MLELNLPGFQHQLRKQGGTLQIFDEYRRKWLVLTPEEWVRQHFVHYMVKGMGCSASLIKLEYPLSFNGQARRADIVLFNSEMQPHWIIECKAPFVELSLKTSLQLASYNTSSLARYLSMSNGLQHYHFELAQGKEYEPLEGFPTF